MAPTEIHRDERKAANERGWTRHCHQLSAVEPRRILTGIVILCIIVGAAIGLAATVGTVSASESVTQHDADSHESLHSQQASHEYQEKSDSVATFDDNVSLSDARTKIYGAGESDSLGETVAGIGNVSGTEYDDVAIGAPHADNETGAVYLFFGPIAENEFNASAANLTLTGETSGDLAGMDVASADLTDDGMQDLVVGSPRANDETVGGGAVYIFYGEYIRAHIADGNTTVNLTEASETIYGADEGDAFGHSVTTYNNASATDEDDSTNVMETFLAVGAPGVDNETGAAYVFDRVGEASNHTDLNVSRASSKATQRYMGESINDLAGWSVAAVENYTDAGEPMLAVGAPGNNTGGENAGAVYVLTDPLANGSLATTNLTFTGSNEGAAAGWVVADANDVSGDDRHDLVVGAPWTSYTGQKAGAAYVHFAASERDGIVSLSKADATLKGEPGDLAGWSVAGVTNLTCTCSGVLVGSPTADGSGENAGVVSLVGGDALMTKASSAATVVVKLTDAQTTLVGESPGDRAGTAIDAPGDVTGSDTGDILVGAPGYNSSENSTYEKEELTVANKTHTDIAIKSRGAAYIVEGERPDKKAFFDVKITEKNDPIEAGETLEVTAEVTNTGDRADTQDVRLKIDGEWVDTYEGLYLKPGESKTVTLTWETSHDDVGDHWVNVYTKDDRDKQKITVTEPPEKDDFFAVEIVDKNDPIEAGETLDVKATVTNTGEEAGTQDVQLKIGKERIDVAKGIELAPSESKNVTLRWKAGPSDVGDHWVNVYTKDDRDKQKITVTEPPEKDDFFDVEIVEKNDPVEAGETLETTAEITNTGDAAGTQDVRLMIDSKQVDVYEGLKLDPGESKTVTLIWETGYADVGDHLVKVLTDDDYDKQKVAVEKPPAEEAFFDLNFVEKNDPVEAGETLTAEVAVTNTGEQTDTQDIWMKVKGERVSVAEDVTLEPGQTETVTLTWETDHDDVGEHWVKVYSHDDRIKQQVTVEEPPVKEAFFDVEIVEKNDPIEAGETLEATAEITNTGDEAGVQDIRLTINSQQVDIYEGLELEPGESERVTLTWVTDEDDVGKHMVNVSSDDDFDKQKISVKEAVEKPFFEVSDITKTDEGVIKANETLTFNATVINTGEVEDTQTVNLTITDDETDEVVASLSEEVTLEPGESTTLSLVWEDTTPGNYTALVETEDDSDSQPVIVERPDEQPFFEVSDITKTDEGVIEANETLIFNATITNTGEIEDTQTVNMSITDDETGEIIISETFTVTLEPDESTTLTLVWEDTVAGNYTALVETEDDSDSQPVIIERPDDPPFFEVSDITKTDGGVIEANETLTFNATVTNTGETEGTQTVNLTITDDETGTIVASLSEEVTLEPGASTTLTLVWEDTAAGNYTALVETDDDSQSQPVTVERPDEPPFFEVSEITKTDGGVIEANETLTFNATTTNTGEIEGTQTVNLTITDDDETDEVVASLSEEVTLGPGESTTLSLLWEETAPGNYTALVETENDSDSQPVIVERPDDPPFFEVSEITKTDGGEIEANETLTFNATITNTGEIEDTQTVNLTITDDETDEVVASLSEEVTLGPGESTTLTLVWEDTVAGNYTALVETEDDSDSQPVIVERPDDPPFFEVSEITKTDGGVIEANETLIFNATITNTGEIEDTQTINLTITDDETDEVVASLSEEVTLGPSESTTLTLVWEDAVAGNYTALVETEDDSDSQPVIVERPDDPPFFEVSEITKTDGGVIEANETLTFNATVTNTGEIEGTQTVNLTITDDETDDVVASLSEEVTLGPGESTTLSLVWEDTAAGNYTALVETEDDSDSQPVTVVDPVEPDPRPAISFVSFCADEPITAEDVTISNFETKPDEPGDPISVTWQSEIDLASVTYKAGNLDIKEVEGGTSGSFEVTDGTPRSELSPPEPCDTDYWIKFEWDKDQRAFIPEDEGGSVPDSLSLSLDEETLTEGETTQATVTAHYEGDADSEDVTDAATITSSNPDVADVESATITAVGNGSAEIEAEYEDLEAEGTFTVEAEETVAEIESIDLQLVTADLEVDQTVDYTVTAQYTDGSTEDVTAEAAVASDNADVAAASESDQTVTGMGEGQATITAEYDELSDGVIVNVTMTETSVATEEIDGEEVDDETDQEEVDDEEVDAEEEDNETEQEDTNDETEQSVISPMI